MHMFGLKSAKPLGVARFGGLRFLRIRRAEASPGAPDIQYLRHAGAMSAAIAKNMTSIMSQSSDFIQSSAKSDTSDFLAAHSHYSFIAVVALMSLFLVVTISATGLLLAFCRKKNTVFTAPSKEDNDSQFELDDVESSDTEICRGHKGECYIHLSDDYDDGDNDSEDDCKRKNSHDNENEEKETNSKCAKQLKKFQRIREILKHCSSIGTSNKATESSKQQKSPKSVAPLLHFNKPIQAEVQVCRGSKDQRQNVAKKTSQLQEKQTKHNHQDWVAGYSKVVCHNPNHKHQYNHLNFLYRHCNHQRQGKPCRAGRTHVVHPCSQHHFTSCSGRLQRSHTIHAIPQTAKRSQSTSVTDSQTGNIRIRIEDVDNAMTVDSLCQIPRDVTQIQQKPHDTSEIEILNDEEEDQVNSKKKSPFDNLQLRLEVDNDKETYTNQSDHDPEAVNIDVHLSSTGDTVNKSQNDTEVGSVTRDITVTKNEDSSAISHSTICFSSSKCHHDTELDSRSSPCSSTNIPLSSTKESKTVTEVMSAVRTSDERAPNLHNISNKIEPFQPQTPSNDSRPKEKPSNCERVLGQSLPTPTVVNILQENQSPAVQSFHSNSTSFGNSSEFHQGQRKAASPSVKHIWNTEHKTTQIVTCESNTLDDDKTIQTPFAKFPGSTSYRRIPSDVTEEDKLGKSYPEPQYNPSVSKDNSYECTQVRTLLDTTSKHWEMRSSAHEDDDDEYNEEGDSDNYYLTKSDYDGDDDEDDQTAALLK
ncbi:hypothetical protein BsWGS_17159 [Bradybaena similaris]